MSIKTAGDYIQEFKERNRPKQKTRVPVKKQLLNQKIDIKKGAIEELKRKRRTIPKEWLRGFDSAVSTIEIFLEK